MFRITTMTSCLFLAALHSPVVVAAPLPEQEPPRIEWTFSSTQKPTTVKPLTFTIHQKTLQPHDVTATIRKRNGKQIPGQNEEPEFHLTVDYAAVCPKDGKPVSYDKPAKIVTKETATSLSLTHTVLVENLNYLTNSSCSSLLTSGSVALTAIVVGPSGSKSESTVKFILLP